MEFSRPEYWSGQPFLSPGDLSNSGIEPRSPALQADSLPSEPPGKPKNTGAGIPSPGIFPTQESNWGLLHCRQILEGIVGEFFTVLATREAPGGSDGKEFASIILTLTLTLGHLSRSSGGGLLFNLCV